MHNYTIEPSAPGFGSLKPSASGLDILLRLGHGQDQTHASVRNNDDSTRITSMFRAYILESIDFILEGCEYCEASKCCECEKQGLLESAQELAILEDACSYCSMFNTPCNLEL